MHMDEEENNNIIKCEICDAEYDKRGKTGHVRSKKHLEALEAIEAKKEQEAYLENLEKIESEHKPPEKQLEPAPMPSLNTPPQQKTPTRKSFFESLLDDKWELFDE